MIGYIPNPINERLPLDLVKNSLADMAERAGGRLLCLSRNVNFTGIGQYLDSIRAHSTVEVIDAFAIITDVTTLTNLTDVYFTLHDGTNEIAITATPGATLSGAPVGSMIFRTQDASQPVTAVLSDQCRVTESDTSKKTHQPFIVTAKNGADTRIRMYMSTTDVNAVFSIDFFIIYKPKDGGYLEDTSI